MSPLLYLLATVLIIGGKLNNLNIKNHPLDIRVRRDVRLSLDKNEPASKELDTKGKLSSILDYERVKKQQNAILRIHVENNAEELSDILKKEALATNQELSSDRDDRQRINVISVNPEDFSNIVGADEINANKKLYSYQDPDPAGKFYNINSEELSDVVNDDKAKTAVDDPTIEPNKEDGREKEIKQHGINRSKSIDSIPIKIIHQNVEEKAGNAFFSTFKSLSRKYTKNNITRKKRDQNNKAYYNQQTNGWQRPPTNSGISTQNRTYTNHGMIRNTNTNIMSLYARLPYQKIANTSSYYRNNYTRAFNRTYHNGSYPKFILHNQTQPTYRVPLAPYRTNQGNINRGNSTNNGLSQNSYNTYNQSQLIYRLHPMPYSPNQDRLYNNKLNQSIYGSYNQSQPSDRVPLAPYNTNQGRIYNGNIMKNGLNKTGYGSTNYHITPVPFNPYQGGDHNRNVNVDYPLNNPLYNNSAGYAPTYTIGYQVPSSTTTETTTPLIVEGCILCVSHGCPSLFRRVGFLCLPAKKSVNQ